MWPSVSVAVSGAPTAVPADEFSAMLRVVVAHGNSASTFLSCVFEDPLSDQSPSPSSFFALICTSYSVPSARPVSRVETPVPVCVHVLHVVVALFLYRTS